MNASASKLRKPRRWFAWIERISRWAGLDVDNSFPFNTFMWHSIFVRPRRRCRYFADNVPQQTSIFCMAQKFVSAPCRPTN
jgi:hypothetical protein